MDVGKRIRALRDKRGIEQMELAEKIGISQSKMNKIETGFQKRIEPEILVELANFFNVSTDYLLGHDSDSDDEELKRESIINKIKTEFPDADLMFNDLASMTAEDLEEVYEFIKFKLSQKE